jgi:hypothetical protein
LVSADKGYTPLNLSDNIISDIVEPNIPDTIANIKQKSLHGRYFKELVALRNATKAIGRSRRPRGPTYARGANRSQSEDPELAVNARHLAARRAHPAFKFFTSLIPEAESFNLESFVPATTGGLEEHMLTPQMSG